LFKVRERLREGRSFTHEDKYENELIVGKLLTRE